MLYEYALFVSIVCSIFVVLGFALKKDIWIASAALASCFTASPIITFTRGAAGAIIPSDIVGIVLLFSFFLFRARPFDSSLQAHWQVYFRRLVIIIVASIIFVSPIFNFFFLSDEYFARVQTIPGVPLPVLMLGFRLLKIMGLVAFTVYFSRANLDRQDFYRLIDIMLWLFVFLAVAEILTRLDIYNLSLYLEPRAEYSGPRVLGFSKATISRLLAFGGFLVLMRMYKSVNPIYFIALSIIFLGIIFSGSRGSVLIIVAGVGVFAAYGRLAGSFLASFLLIMLGSAVAATYLLNDEIVYRLAGTFDQATVSNLSSRLDIWLATLGYWLANPWVLLTGAGAMNFSYAVSLSGVDAEHAHSDYLTVATELGLLGLWFLLGFVFAFLKTMRNRVLSSRGRERWDHLCLFAAFAGLTAAGLFETTLYIHTGNIPMLRVVFGVLLLYELVHRREPEGDRLGRKRLPVHDRLPFRDT